MIPVFPKSCPVHPVLQPQTCRVCALVQASRPPVVDAVADVMCPSCGAVTTPTDEGWTCDTCGCHS